MSDSQNESTAELASSDQTRVGVISLGCAKNLVDTEVMLGHLDRAGCRLVSDPADADVIIVNTCGFIGPARQESIDAILDAAEYKKDGHLKKLVVAGCMVQRYAGEMRESLPEVDAFIGLDELGTVVGRVLGEERATKVATAPLVEAPAILAGDGLRVLTRGQEGESRGEQPVQSTYLYDHRAPRRTSTPPWTAYVKIAEGCDHTCSFCAIPSFRGVFRSRPIESITEEARRLVGAGAIELNLIAQDSSHFGRDRGDHDGLANLIRALDDVEGLRWVRIHYLYPNTVTDRLIDAMAQSSKVVPYVDMPLQHAHPAMLTRMRRGGSSERHLELLARFRRAMPGAALRTTMIVGFPGETEEEFEELVRFVDAAQFDHLGVFTYSHEEGTAAGELADDVPEKVKEARRAKLMRRQRTIAKKRLKKRVGEIVDVLVEGVHPETDMLLVGRMATQAIEVDGQVLINDGTAAPGEMVRVELSEVAGYDLVGSIVDPE